MRFFGFGKDNVGDKKEQKNIKGNLIGLEMPKIKDPVLAEQAKRLNDEGLELYHENDFEGAKARWQEALKIDPEYAEPYHHLFAVYQKSGDMGKSIEAVVKFVRFADPSNPAAAMLKPLADSMANLPADTFAGVQVPESASRLCMQAIGCAKAGKHEEALSLFRKAVELEPDYAAALSDMGYCLLQMGRYTEAMEPLLKASRLAPDDLANWGFLVMAYTMLNDDTNARSCIERCVQLGATEKTLADIKATCLKMRRDK